MYTTQQVKTAQYQRCGESSSPPTIASTDPVATWNAVLVDGRVTPILPAGLAFAAVGVTSCAGNEGSAGSCGPSSTLSPIPSAAACSSITAFAKSPTARKTSCIAGEVSGKRSS